eukprot:2373829-Alexandrium_andersonii.AAC.1
MPLNSPFGARRASEGIKSSDAQAGVAPPENEFRHRGPQRADCLQERPVGVNFRDLEHELPPWGA